MANTVIEKDYPTIFEIVQAGFDEKLRELHRENSGGAK